MMVGESEKSLKQGMLTQERANWQFRKAAVDFDFCLAKARGILEGASSEFEDGGGGKV